MFVLAHAQLVGFAVEHHGQRDLAFGRHGRVAQHRGPALIGGQGFQRGRGETFGVHAVGSHARFQQRLLRGLDHGLRAADEHLVHAAHGQQRGDEGAHLVAVDAAFEQRHFLGLAREHVDQREAAGVLVLQVLQRFVEHHAGHAAVAVDQGEFRFGRFFERAGHDGQDGRDARAGRKAHAVDGAWLVHGEAAVGRHHTQRVPGLEIGRRPVRKHAAFDRPDAKREFTLLREQAARAADGVAAPHVLPADGGAQREELARFESEGFAQLGRNAQRNRHRPGGLGLDARDGEVVEAGGGVAHGVNTV